MKKFGKEEKIISHIQIVEPQLLFLFKKMLKNHLPFKIKLHI
jgi:hypothetical protein